MRERHWTGLCRGLARWGTGGRRCRQATGVYGRGLRGSEGWGVGDMHRVGLCHLQYVSCLDVCSAFELHSLCP